MLWVDEVEARPPDLKWLLCRQFSYKRLVNKGNVRHKHRKNKQRFAKEGKRERHTIAPRAVPRPTRREFVLAATTILRVFGRVLSLSAAAAPRVAMAAGAGAPAPTTLSEAQAARTTEVAHAQSARPHARRV